MMNKRLPAEVKDAIIQVCGRCFWLKQPLYEFLADAGVSWDTIYQFQDEAKFIIARKVLHALEQQGEEGYNIQRKLLTALCNLRKPPDPTVPDFDSAIEALRELKTVAVRHNIVRQKVKQDEALCKFEAEQRMKEIAAKQERLQNLNKQFQSLFSSTEKQDRGYSLEDLVQELFELNEILYRKSYKTATEQIDGSFRFEGFDYLVEARWRRDKPTESDLGALKLKVDK